MSDEHRPPRWGGNYLALHLALFLILIPLLTLIDFLVGDAWWVHWALLGWGAAVLTHAFFVFGTHRGGDHAEVAEGEQGRSA